MSHWTHITACLSVETGIIETRKKLAKIVRDYLKKAPKITGSEKDADFYVNVQNGHNVWMGQDCEHCKYRETLRPVIIDGKEIEECDAPEDHDCSADYQTCVVISIQGDLRDRTKEETQKEFDEFIKYITTKCYIRDYSVNIEGE